MGRVCAADPLKGMRAGLHMDLTSPPFKQGAASFLHASIPGSAEDPLLKDEESVCLCCKIAVRSKSASIQGYCQCCLLSMCDLLNYNVRRRF